MMVVLLVMLALLPAGLAQAKSQVRGTTTHEFVGTVEDGYLRAWVGEIDIDGEDFDIEWRIELASMRETGKASHYSMVVRISDDTGVVLETEERGTTTSPNSTWRARGVVTRAEGHFANWLGRSVHESGHFWVTDTGGLAGESTFRLN